MKNNVTGQILKSSCPGSLGDHTGHFQYVLAIHKVTGAMFKGVLTSVSSASFRNKIVVSTHTVCHKNMAYPISQ